MAPVPLSWPDTFSHSHPASPCFSFDTEPMQVLICFSINEFAPLFLRLIEGYFQMMFSVCNLYTSHNSILLFKVQVESSEPSEHITLQKGCMHFLCRSTIQGHLQVKSNKCEACKTPSPFFGPSYKFHGKQDERTCWSQKSIVIIVIVMSTYTLSMSATTSWQRAV